MGGAAGGQNQGLRGQFGQQFGGGGGVQADLHPGQFHLAGQGQALLFVLVDEVGACVLAGVAQLHTGHRPVALDGVGQKGPAGQIARGPEVKVEHVGSVGGRVDNQLAGGDCRRAALGPQFIETGGVRGPTLQSAVMSVPPMGAENMRLRNTTRPRVMGAQRWGYFRAIFHYLPVDWGPDP